MSRRKRKKNVFATVPGQSGNIKVAGSQYGIFREPDQFTIHKKPGAEHVTVEGGKHHINIHAGGRGSQRRGPLFIWEEMQRDLVERIEARLGAAPINFAGIKEPLKKKKRLEAIRKNFWKGKRYYMHPFGLTAALLERIGHKHKLKLADRRRAIALRNELRLEQRYAVEVKMLQKTVVTALAELKQAVSQGKVNWYNRNFYAQEFERIISKAEARYGNGKRDMLWGFERAWNAKSSKKVVEAVKKELDKMGCGTPQPIRIDFEKAASVLPEWAKDAA